MPRITIKDIARIAGVSVTTVSRALNNAPEISEETRSRILAVCREQGYHRNLLARSLISSRTHVLGIILPEIAGPFHASLSLHIETFAREQGYQVMLCCSTPDDTRINEHFDFMLSQRVDGILLSSSSNSVYDLLSRYQSEVPLVLLGACPPEDSAVRINSVSTDNYLGGKMAAEYLYRLGHRDTIYLGMRTGSITHQRRHKGFQDTADRLGMRVLTLVNNESSSTVECGYHLAQGIFSKPFSQTAVFTASDMLALGTMQAADEAGIAIPERLSILGFDNIAYAGLPKVQLTTFSQHPESLAKAAVRLLLERIENPEEPEYTQKLLVPSLVERKTCRSILL
ncbi:MAG: LacI family DNA-binding transcriptional regulator [Butyricicoccus sp.]|nr:LacI family DNA-binding transcriptional regulator [Butyricicoccus sp.]MBQ8585564.1 LacI family DNA-binding transcriptional regulator [Butyricicoccus sp.]